ncbi:MAG: AAA family ATPase [Myxococcota bacterium]
MNRLMVVWFWLLSAGTAHAETSLMAQVCAAWAESPIAAPADPVDALALADGSLLHAETYYWWARGAGNSVEMHCRSVFAYQDAIRALSAHPITTPELLQAADAGLVQAEWRVDNTFDMFRNQYPLAWWMLGDDPVIEPEDGPGALPDFAARAVESAWLSMEAVLNDPEKPRTLAVIRCKGAAAGENCPGLRDFMAILADAHPRLATIPDDRGTLFVGAQPWQDLISGGPITAPTTAALASSTGFDEVVLIDMDIADAVAAPAEGVRVELTADRLWLRAGQRQTRLASGTGIAADYVPRRNLDMVWVLGLILFGVLLSPLRRIASPPSVEAESWGLYIGQLVGGLTIGSGLGLFSLRLTGALAPGMEDLALNPIGMPLLATLVWPLAHGSLLLLGPLFLCVFLVFGIMPRIHAALAERLDLGLLTLAIQCGALAFALAPIPTGEGVMGIFACGALALPSMTIAAIIGERIEQIRSLVDVEPSRQIAPFAMALLGALAGFPLMLTGRFPLEMLAGGAILSGLIAWLGHPRSKPRRAPTPRPIDTDPDQADVGGGTLRRPAYVSLDGRDVTPIVAHLSTPGVSIMAIDGSAGVGKSRLSEEVHRQLSGDWKVGRCEAEDPQLSEGCVEPYAAIGSALGAIFDQERVELAAIYARQVAVRELAASASEALDFLPGVGLLLGMGGEGVDSDRLTLDRLRRDVVRAIRRQLREQPVLLIVDDLQWADPSSLSLLEHILLELSHQPADSLGHPFGALLLHRPLDQGDVTDWLERLGGRVPIQTGQLEPLSDAGVEALLRCAGVWAESPRFAAAVRRQVGGVPLNILALMHELVKSGLSEHTVTENAEALIHVPPEIDEERLRAVVPGQMADLARQRLHRLRPEELLLLQGAAQCGRRFDATSLSSGFGLPRIEVLRRLRDIEDQHEMITDLDDDDHFRFDTEVTRAVLIEMTTKRRGHGQRELVKEFHYRVVGALIERDRTEDWSEERDAARVVRHALNAGSRRAGVAGRYAIRAAQSAARRFAYPEALRFVNVAREPARLARLSTSDAIDLSLIEARIRRAIGGRDNREIAIRRFAGLLNQPNVDTLALARDWFEAIFEDKQPASLAALTDAIQKVRAVIDPQQPDPLVETVCDFYEALNQTWLENLRPPEASVAVTLGSIAARLRDLDDVRRVERERLLSWVLQTQATWTGDGDEVVRLCQESLLLKERHNDLAGQALTKGVLANHYLFKRREPARARTLLAEDLQILEQMGARGDRSSVLNRMAMADWMEASQTEDANKKRQLQARALQNARRAVDAAVQTGRAVDLIFASFEVLSYSSQLGEGELVDQVGESLVSRPENWPWPDPDALWAEVPNWLRSTKQKQLEQLLPALRDISTRKGWHDQLNSRLSHAS